MRKPGAQVHLSPTYNRPWALHVAWFMVANTVAVFGLHPFYNFVDRLSLSFSSFSWFRLVLGVSEGIGLRARLLNRARRQVAMSNFVRGVKNCSQPRAHHTGNGNALYRLIRCTDICRHVVFNVIRSLALAPPSPHCNGHIIPGRRG